MSLDGLRVGIVIAAYNAADTIARAVKSALAQAFVAEVVVVDDASTDATALLAHECNDRTGRLTIVRLETNSGPAAARNAGLDRIKSPWLCVLDADDFMQEGRVARMLALTAECDFLIDELLRADHHTHDAPTPVRWGAPSQGVRQISFDEFIRANLSEGRSFHIDLGFAKPLIRKSFLDRHHLRYQTEMRLGEDYEFYARALLLGAEFAMTSAQGYVSVNKPGSLSNQHSIADLRRLRDCDRELSRVRSLTRRETGAVRHHTTSVDKRLQWRLLIEAVKASNPTRAFLTFRSPSVAVYLAANLLEQVRARYFSKATRSDSGV